MATWLRIMHAVLLTVISWKEYLPTSFIGITGNLAPYLYGHRPPVTSCALWCHEHILRMMYHTWWICHILPNTFDSAVFHLETLPLGLILRSSPISFQHISICSNRIENSYLSGVLDSASCHSKPNTRHDKSHCSHYMWWCKYIYIYTKNCNIPII